jgi:hypothetical protein
MNGHSSRLLKKIFHGPARFSLVSLRMGREDKEKQPGSGRVLKAVVITISNKGFFQYPVKSKPQRLTSLWVVAARRGRRVAA